MIRIPCFEFHIYGLFMLIGVVLYFVNLFYFMIKRKYEVYEIMGFITFQAMAIIFAMAFFGNSFSGLIMCILISVLYNWICKKDIKELIAMVLIGMPLLYGMGKLGCFFGGCCYGINYDGIFNVIYTNASKAPNDVSRFPVQLIEAILSIFSYICTLIIYKKKKDEFVLIPFIMISCGFIKFVFDFLRADRNSIISINQLFCIISVIIGIIIHNKIVSREKEEKN